MAGHGIAKITKAGVTCECGTTSADRAAHKAHKATGSELLSPLAIDTKLAEMWIVYWAVMDRTDPLHRANAEDRKMVRAGYDQDSYYSNRIAERETKIKAIVAEAKPLGLAARAYDDANYRGWTRFFTVQDGHIHRPNCHTLRPTTRVGWTPSLSGHNEKSAVEALGPMLCTHCFPSAPVAWTSGQKSDECPGSKTYDYDRATARIGYYSGNAGTCNHCGQRVTLTTTNKMRAHKPA